MAVGFPTKVDYATGDVLSADNMNDLSGTVNLLQSAYESAAGVNKIINGDFGINQRAFTSTTLNDIFTFDRWQTGVASMGTGTATYTPQVFTPGTAPVTGYESTNFLRIVTTGLVAGGTTSSQVRIGQKIEDVRTLANQTATVSFWAKSASGTPNLAVAIVQNFGTGGTASPVTTLAESVKTITTSWARYSFTVAVPSVSGKTIGTSSNLNIRLFVSAGSSVAVVGSVGLQDNTFDIWGVQVEAGSTATPFQTATGTIQGELAACQRYYYRATVTATGQHFANGNVQDTQVAIFVAPFPTIMRIAPTALEQSGTATDYSIRVSATNTTCNAVPAFTNATPQLAIFGFSVASGLVAGTGAFARPNVANTYLGWSAEL